VPVEIDAIALVEIELRLAGNDRRQMKKSRRDDPPPVFGSTGTAKSHVTMSTGNPRWVLPAPTTS